MVSIKKVVAVVILTLMCGCSPSNWTQNNSHTSPQTQSELLPDTLIIPGKRVGAVNAKTTRADLVKMFGESNLKDDVILEDEGTISVPVTKVNNGGENYFTIVWEEAARKKILYIRDFGSAWKTPEGIGIGTSFKELRSYLGDFKLYGLGWDSGGIINLETTKLSKYQGKLSLKVSPDEKAVQKNFQQYEAVLGDRELSSTDPNWQPLDMKVSQTIVLLDK
jgi:hypothetical protein